MIQWCVKEREIMKEVNIADIQKLNTIREDQIDELYTNKYLNLYQMHFKTNPHYLVSSRRAKGDLVALKSEEEYREMLPDAVTIVLVVKTPDSEPRLYLEREFRYPVGHFLVGPPAGLIDEADKHTGQDPRIVAAKREIREETGIEVKDTDEIYAAAPLVFSTPGMTDESNAMVCAKVSLPDLSSLKVDLAESTECFGPYSLYTKDEVRELLKTGRDDRGLYYSVFTWAILMYFLLEC